MVNEVEPALTEFVIVTVQVYVLPIAMTPLTLLLFTTVRSGARFTVLLSVFEVTPPAVADAVFVTDFAVTSPAVTV